MLKLRNLAVAVCLVMLFAGIAIGAEVMVTGTVQTIVKDATDKNGNSYARAIIAEPASLGGVQYSRGIPAMFFGTELHEAAQSIEAGDQIKFIATKRMFNGRESYTVLKIVP